MRIADAVLLAILTETEPISRASLQRSARDLLELLARNHYDLQRAAETLDPTNLPIAPFYDSGTRGSLGRWERELAHASPSLIEAKTLRVIVEEALLEAKASALAVCFPRPRALEILEDFAQTIDLDRFVDPHGKGYREWVDAVVPRQVCAPGVATPHDVALRQRIQGFSARERRTIQSISLNAQTSLRDLTPLAELPNLRWLHIEDAECVDDVSPLAELQKLKDLSLAARCLKDVSPLGKLSRLKRLEITGSLVEDIAPLAHLRKLDWLSLRYSSRLADLGPLGSLPALRSLYLRDTGARDLSPIGRIATLTDLYLGESHVEDYSPLGSLTRLRRLFIAPAPSLRDLSALASLNALEEFHLQWSGVTDVTPLLGLPSLRVLEIRFSPVETVPLRADFQRLEELDVRVA